jgi:hypothetical protein
MYAILYDHINYREVIKIVKLKDTAILNSEIVTIDPDTNEIFFDPAKLKDHIEEEIAVIWPEHIAESAHLIMINQELKKLEVSYE